MRFERLWWKKQKIPDRDRRKSFLLAWLEPHEHRQDPGENGRRIEHFIGENEHLYEIIGGRPVYCQKLINGGRRGYDTWRHMVPHGNIMIIHAAGVGPLQRDPRMLQNNFHPPSHPLARVHAILAPHNRACWWVWVWVGK